jgi:hypothetical protein
VVRALDVDEHYLVETSASQRQNIRFYFQHYVDLSTFPQPTHYVHITDAVVFTNLIYHTFIQLGEYRDRISVGFSTTGAYETNLSFIAIDACTRGINQPCTVGLPCGDHSNHHKSVERISDVLLERRGEDTSSRQFSVLWCDRTVNTFCSNDSFFHERLSSFAVVVDERPVIHVMRLTNDDSENTAAMSIILAHEVAHCLHYDDVYDSDNHENDGIHECLMDYLQPDYFDINDLYDGMRARPSGAFCEFCKHWIGDRILNFFYEE